MTARLWGVVARIQSFSQGRCRTFTHILLPTDGSARSEAAVRSGLRLAKALSARVTGVCVAPKVRQMYFD